MASFSSEASISAISFTRITSPIAQVAGEPLQPRDTSVGKQHVAKGWSKGEEAKLLQGKTILSPGAPFENIGAILVSKLIGSAIELNGVSFACISVLLKDVTMLLTLLNSLASCFLRSIPLWLNKIQNLKFKKRAPVT